MSPKQKRNPCSLLHSIYYSYLIIFADEEDDGPVQFGSITQHLAPHLDIHRAAFENDTQALLTLIQQSDPAVLYALDSQGNTPLHVAVLARSTEAIELLLKTGGISVEIRNSKKWNPLDEAIAVKDHELIKILLQKLRLEVKKERKARKPRLLKVMNEMPNFSMELKWSLGSPLFGWFLKKYAPSDTYLMFKVGSRLRIDGSLRGIDPNSNALLPKWKHGPFSLLVDASTTPVSAALVDHTDATWIDIYAERKAAVKDIDQDVRDLIEAGAGRVRLKKSEIDLAPKMNFVGKQTTEKIENYHTNVFEISGRLVAQVIAKSPIFLPRGTTFDQYLAMKMPDDVIEEVPWDPLKGPPPSVSATLKGGISGSNNQEEAQAVVDFQSAAERAEEERLVAEGEIIAQARDSTATSQTLAQAREIKGVCWMAKDYPISLRQLLPLLEAVGGANKHIAAAAGFIAAYRNDSLFPVKIKVPLMWTVHLMLRFKKYRELKQGVGEPALEGEIFFEVPRGYTKVALMGEQGGAGAENVEDTFYEANE